MLVTFQSHPDGNPVEVDTKRVATVRPARDVTGVAIIRLADGRDIFVKATKAEVMEKLEMSNTIRTARKA